MRKLIILVTLICLPALSAAAEMRGLWVDAWHHGFKSPEETAEMISAAKACNFTDLIVEVRKRGDVYYNSAIEPMAADVAQGYDPLADILAKAHEAGLRVHAWMITYDVYHDTKFNKADPRQVHVRHPEWLMRNDRGEVKLPGDRLFLDPGLKEVQLYLADIVSEIASKYPVDGVHLDIVRYPSAESGYNEGSLDRFKKETGKQDKPEGRDEAWGNWRRDQVTQFVKLANQRLKKVNKDAVLSAAVFANRHDAYLNKMQDWDKWLNTGLIDFAVPMIFLIDNGAYTKLCKQTLEVGDNGPVYIGQGAFKLGVKETVRQVNLARKAGATGIFIYSYEAIRKPRGNDDISVLDALRAGPFAKPAAN